MSLRIARRKTIPALHAWGIRAAALIIALIIGGLIIIALGHNPLRVYLEMINSAFGGRIGFNQKVRIFIPLLGAALAVGLAFKMRFWNIGAEGQILVGGIAASYFALFHPNMPRPVLLITMGLAAAIAGGLWGLIPAFFRARWGTNETLFTLMLNYVALGIISYLQSGPWRSAGTLHPIIDMFPAAARLPQVFGIHIGWIMVLVFTVLVYLYISRSKQGYQLTVVGESENTARYAGMNVGHIIMRTMILSGAIAGLAGFWQVSGADFTLNETTAGGVGFTAIIVAWLSRLNPIVMVPVALFIALLERGAVRIQTIFMIPATIAAVLIGIILFAMLACEFFVQYRVVRNVKVPADASFEEEGAA
ncbi:MAG: ABC transporter permease [Defluviitaleaceae bacterium]|nr:ABC transporter permease [Defluviitaleaceae bacterium]MCL2273299.1 ABC transporter permease [Defluviitaleaceae bacterium]